MREEITVELKDRKLIYETCSHGEALHNKHTMVMYINRNAIKYFRLKEVKELLVG